MEEVEQTNVVDDAVPTEQAPAEELATPAENKTPKASTQEESPSEKTGPEDLADSETETPEPGEQQTVEGTEAQDALFIAEAITEPAPEPEAAGALKAVIEAAIYITDEPLSAEQIATAIEQPLDRVKEILAQLVSEYAAPDRGLSIREIAGGYKMATKPEHHEAIRRFVKNLQPPLKLSLAALETLAVIAYKQPITAPEIMDIRGVQGAGVLKTLLDRKLIATAGRKNVLGKPIMYKTTREFLLQFGLASLTELPTLKEFEELGRMALSDAEENVAPPTAEDDGQKTETVATDIPAGDLAAEDTVAESAPEREPEQRAPQRESAEAARASESTEPKHPDGEAHLKENA